ncbi:MAG: electron transport complex subunit RsxA [Tissierellia bacterium]|jgi:electron transport complex protein RnfA|nr:electron transport complex subunit RsxA [Bacillota bacterium]NLK57735.1 electron transport complex subunit RsxA [Tissierellia bacterium]
MMANIFQIIIASIFVNNYVFARFLGICPLLGVSNKTETAAGMGVAVTFVITLASAITWVVHEFVLSQFGLEYLMTIVFILVIAALVQFVEMFLKKSSPGLYNALGVYLPLITTNCVVLGVAILNITSEYNFIEMIVNALGSSIGFLIAIVFLAAIRERIDIADVPEVFKGFPISLVTVGLMSMAFMGFQGLV